MKKYLFAALFAALSTSCGPATGYRIDVTLTDAPDKMKVYLCIANGLGEPLDSAVIVNGKFSFEPTLAYPRLCNIVLLKTEDPNDREYMSNPTIGVFVDKGRTRISGTMAALSMMEDVSGGQSADSLTIESPAHSLYAGFMKGMKEYNRAFDETFRPYSVFLTAQSKGEGLPSEQGIELVNRLDSVKAAQAGYICKFVGEHSESPVVLTVIERYINAFPSVGEIDRVMSLVSPRLLAGEGLDAFNNKIERAKRSAVGAKFIDHELFDPQGNPVKFSDYIGKGNYVMIDFWASWCGPCRSDLPHVRKMYALYHPKGFEVLGVSMDSEKDAWLQALDEEKLAWPQMSDMKAFGNSLSETYNFNGIPTCILFSPDGTIIHRNLRGSWMDRELLRIYGPAEVTAAP